MMHLPLYSVTAVGVTPLSFLTHLLPLPLPYLLSSPSSLPSYSGLSPPCAVPTPAACSLLRTQPLTAPSCSRARAAWARVTGLSAEDGCSSVLPCGSGGPRSLAPMSPILRLTRGSHALTSLLSRSASSCSWALPLVASSIISSPSRSGLPPRSFLTCYSASLSPCACSSACVQSFTVTPVFTPAPISPNRSAVLSDGCQPLPPMSVLLSSVFPPFFTAPSFSPLPSASAAAGTHALPPASSSLSSTSAAASTPTPGPTYSPFSSASAAAGTHAQVPSFSSFSSPSTTAHALTFVARSLPPSLPPLRSPMASLLRSTAQGYSGSCSPSSFSSSSLTYSPACLSVLPLSARPFLPSLPSLHKPCSSRLRNARNVYSGSCPSSSSAPSSLAYNPASFSFLPPRACNCTCNFLIWLLISSGDPFVPPAPLPHSLASCPLSPHSLHVGASGQSLRRCPGFPHTSQLGPVSSFPVKRAGTSTRGCAVVPHFPVSQLSVPPRSDIITPLLLSFLPLLPVQASSGPLGWGISLGHLHAPPSASLHFSDASLPLQGTAPSTAALCPLTVAPSLLPSRILVTAHLLSCLAYPPRAPFLFLVSATRLFPRNLRALPSLGAPDPIFPFLLPFLPLHPAGIALLRPSSHISLSRATFLLLHLFPLQPSSLPAGVLLLSHDALPHLPLRRWVTNVCYPYLAPSPPAAASLLTSAECAFLRNPRPPPLPTTPAISFLPSPYDSCPPGFVLARANDTLMLAQHDSSPPPLVPLTRAQLLCSCCTSLHLHAVPWASDLPPCSPGVSRHSYASPLAHDLHPRFAPGALRHSRASPLAHDLHPRFALGASRHSHASPLAHDLHPRFALGVSRHSRASPLTHDMHLRFAPGASRHSRASPLAHDLHPRFAPGASRHSSASPMAHDLHPRFALGASRHSHASSLAHDMHPRFAPGTSRHSRASPLAHDLHPRCALLPRPLPSPPRRRPRLPNPTSPPRPRSHYAFHPLLAGHLPDSKDRCRTV
ncbi:unnamed protein product [Closterium sp. NIES-53]